MFILSDYIIIKILNYLSKSLCSQEVLLSFLTCMNLVCTKWHKFIFYLSYPKLITITSISKKLHKFIEKGLEIHLDLYDIDTIDRHSHIPSIKSLESIEKLSLIKNIDDFDYIIKSLNEIAKVTRNNSLNHISIHVQSKMFAALTISPKSYRFDSLLELKMSECTIYSNSLLIVFQNLNQLVTLKLIKSVCLQWDCSSTKFYYDIMKILKGNKSLEILELLYQTMEGVHLTHENDMNSIDFVEMLNNNSTLKQLKITANIEPIELQQPICNNSLKTLVMPIHNLDKFYSQLPWQPNSIEDIGKYDIHQITQLLPYLPNLTRIQFKWPTLTNARNNIYKCIENQLSLCKLYIVVEIPNYDINFRNMNNLTKITLYKTSILYVIEVIKTDHPTLSILKTRNLVDFTSLTDLSIHLAKNKNLRVLKVKQYNLIFDYIKSIISILSANHNIHHLEYCVGLYSTSESYDIDILKTVLQINPQLEMLSIPPTEPLQNLLNSFYINHTSNIITNC
ncbi:hypothetical protein DLAC_11649 [Tieghemostelium lacteum]|uniref:Uncharacterized protein n=1 Tax=Tieghemostelium lacteum TaxID=361077 RepID=A0A151ZEH8_TIELA|nr:hypothetical protein DLAC_11649 [Tieghemostelium lacteum]|eukprot:KYQ92335.1 hypothetical protein DLAC_11649 [Tieghemostelium lacteum]